jgi:hypothetical protein
VGDHVGIRGAVGSLFAPYDFEGCEVLKALFLSFGKISFCSHAVGSNHGANN